MILGAAVWVGFKALTVKTELEAAQSLVSDLDDGMALDERVALLGARSNAAADAANDPVWKIAEFIPLAGDNLRAVRLASSGLDLIVNDIAAPVLAAKSDPAAGSILVAALPIIEAQTPALEELAGEIADVRESGTLIGPVRSGIDQVSEITTAAVPLMKMVPGMLGSSGMKSYLLVFQNNAESLPLGGSAASQTLITADAGRLAIAKQASSASFAEGVPVDVDVDQSAIDLFSSYLIDHVNTSTSRPDFPTAAKILRAFWQRDIDPGPVDGVISIDPIALGRVLVATGPVTVGDVEITSENAVSVLLSESYRWWNPYDSRADALASDAFFAGVAQAVFQKLSTGDFDLKDMAWAVNESVAGGNILMWSDQPAVAGFLDGHRAAGVLPTDNAQATTIGVFFRDTSASKIDYHMRSAVDVTSTCEADATIFTASADLHLDISQEAADELPTYVQSAAWGSDKFRTEVFIYGPPGTAFLDAAVDGQDLRPTRTDITDLGRPVAAFEVFLAPGQTGTVTARFSGSGEFGPLEVRSTPMVRATEVTTDAECL